MKNEEIKLHVSETLTIDVSLKDRLSKRLLKVAEDVPAIDRKEYLELIGVKISAGTLSKYLNGNVSDVETGLGILLFFEGRKAEREKQLNLQS